ncbi:MAG: hypothetical protein RMJ56_17635 [Gemmataceae bacterium]|nr:hypothetical protein [Gemmata sp.]MDW8199420.1 hypothetical protein [Gemmataceae bacterium]
MDERESGASGGGVIPAARVRLSPESVRVGPPRPATAAEREPQLKVIRDGDVVRAIQITCTCGQQMIIQCEYS